MTELNETLRRAAVVRIYDVGDRTVVLDPQGRGHALIGDSAALARAVLAFFVVPHTRAELHAHLAELSGAPIEVTDAVEELVTLLLGARALERGDAAPRAVDHAPGRRVLLGITGAVAAMHAPALVQALLERGFTVRVAMTKEALRFCRTEGLEALTHSAVIADMWPTDDALPVPHIGLAQWADAVLVWPASGTTIARLAGGDFSSIVAAVALSTAAPVMIAPSMNPAMSGSAAVQRNLARLVEDGFHVVQPTTAIEVADRPGDRVPTLGGAPPPSVVVALFETMLREHPRMRPHVAADWDVVYRRDTDTLAWHATVADPDLVEIARTTAAPARVLDIGTGLGVLATACAELGHRVVATDLSSRALDLARAQSETSPVVWIEDDITASRVHSSFDLVLDRGCVHLLVDAQQRAYATNVARLVVAGGRLVIKALVAAPAPGLAALDAARVRSVFGAAFELVSEMPSTMPGPSATPAARLFVLQRRA